LSSAGGNIISPLHLKAFFLGLSSFMPIPIPFFSFTSNFSCYFEKGTNIMESWHAVLIS